MAFVPIIHGRGPQWQPKTRIRLYTSSGAKQLIFTITTSITGELGWNEGDRILVSFGAGADLGRISLSKIKKGGQKLVRYGLQRTACQISCTFPREGIDGITRDMLADVLKSGRDVEYEVLRGQLFVTVAELRAARKPALEAVS